MLGELGSVVRAIGPLVSTSVVFQVLQAAMMAFTALYLVDARGVPNEIAAAMFGIPFLAGMLGAPLGGHLSDRLGRRAVIVLGLVLLGPAWLATVLVPTALLPLTLGAVGVASALRQTVTEVFVTENTPEHRRATYLGGYYMLSQPLGGLAAPLLGLAADATGIGAAFGGLSLALAVLSAAVLVLQPRLR